MGTGSNASSNASSNAPSGASSGKTPGVATVVLADDHAFTIAGMRAALATRPGLEVVATAANGIEAIALVKRHRPTVAVLDYAMPLATGHEAFVEAKRWVPETRFMVVTGLNVPARFAELLEAGVDGILLKSMSPEAVCEAVEAVARGEQVLGDQVRRSLGEAERGDALSPREREVLEGIARGLSNAAIGELLSVSAKTVDKHRASLMRKMGVNTVATLLMRAMRDGLIDA